MNILLVSLVHDRPELLRRAIISVLSQNLPHKHWQYLMYDNNSNKETKHIEDVFASKYPFIKVYHNNRNSTQHEAYNDILYNWIPKNYPKAEIIGILDSDDELCANALSEVNTFFYNNPKVGSSYSDFSVINPGGYTIVERHGKAKEVPNQLSKEGQLALRKLFVSQNAIGHFRVYRVNCLKEIGGFTTQYKFATDYSQAGAILDDGRWMIGKIPKLLYRWRQHNNQIQSFATNSREQTDTWQKLKALYTEKWTKNGMI